MQARVVIVGSGIVGSSIAFHLSRLGWDGIVVVDKGPITHNDGSTSHAPGGVVALSHSKLLTQMGEYGADLYESLPDFDPGRRTVNACGGLEVALSVERLRDLTRLAGEAKSYHSDARLLSPGEVGQVMPHMNVDTVAGALLVGRSQLVAAPHLNGALQRECGPAVTFIPDTAVVDVVVEHGRVRAVRTANPDLPRIDTETVVISTNIWGPLLGEKVGVPIPLHAYDHQYLISPPLDEFARFDASNPGHEVTFPTMRELDTFMYYRQHWNAYGIGSYRHRPRRVSSTAIGNTAMNPFTPEDFLGEPWNAAQRLFPFFRGLDPRDFPTAFNGMFAFSVDGMPIIGESRTKGLWVSTAAWLTHAGGVGKMTAEMMTAGDPEWDPRQVSLHRFHGFQATPAYMAAVCDKNYAEIYDIVHPRQPITSPRNVRLSPFHERHVANGAVFTVFAGIELPFWFESNAGLVDEYRDRIPDQTGWDAEFWSPIVGAEHLVARDRAALVDLHGLSIIEVCGPGAAAFADHLCANRVARSVGLVVYTTWLTHSGGVKRDLAVARVADDRFWFFVGEGTRPQDLRWVEVAAEGWEGVMVADISDAWSAVGLWGPSARDILSRVSSADLSNDGFGYFTARFIDVGMARVLALRVSYVGELGWELHMPVDSALTVWDALSGVGANHGLAPVGMGAFDSLRLEKGYRGWGTDVHTEYNPYEAGLGWTVRLDKESFLGKEAVAKMASPARKLSCLTLDEGGFALGAEPILRGDECVGYVTSANYGYSVGASVVYGYLPAELAVVGTRFEIEYFGERVGATVAPDPLFDPEMDRLKS